MGVALSTAGAPVDWSAEKEGLLDATNDGLDVYAHFAHYFECQGEPRLYKNYPSPFPVTKKYRKGFRLHRPENGRVHYKDNATGREGNCFEFVMELLGYSFRDAKQYVQQTILHGLAPTVLPNARLIERVPRLVAARDTTITVWAREWDERCDFARYDAVGIDRTLCETYHCYPLKAAHVVTDEHNFLVHHSVTNPLYGYWHALTNRWKINQPLNPKGHGQKWYASTKGHEDMFALHLLPAIDQPQAIGIIGPGQRDSLALAALTGYTVHALNSESAHLTADQYALLTARYQRLAFFTDPDEAGDRGAAHLSQQWGIGSLNHAIHPFVGHLDLCEWLLTPLGQSARYRERLVKQVQQAWQAFPSHF